MLYHKRSIYDALGLHATITFFRNKIAVRERRPCVYGAADVLPVYIFRWLHYSSGIRIPPIYKATALYDIYRLSRRRPNSSYDILVKFESALTVNGNVRRAITALLSAGL